MKLPKYLLIVIALILVGVLAVPVISLSTQRRNSASQPSTAQSSPVPTDESITSSQTIRLARGGVTFEVPGDLDTHREDEPKPSDNPAFDHINLYSRASIKSLTPRPGDSSTKNYVQVVFAVSRGWYETSKQMLSFNPIHFASSTKDYIIASDMSVIPTNNPLISTDNIKVTVFKAPVSKNPSIYKYIVELHTNSQYTDGQTHQTRIEIQCDNQLLSPNPRCHDIVQQVLSTLHIQEPLSTDISAITYNGQ